MRIELAIGCPEFAASDAHVHLDIYTPEATIEAITPMIQHGIDVGWVVVKDDPKAPEEAPVEETAGEEASAAEETEETPSATDTARPTEKRQCIGKTKSNSRCKKNALKYSDFCPTHADAEELAKIDQKLAEEAAAEEAPAAEEAAVETKEEE